ncbi:hypothetical protein EZS27_034907, partial [termite gut metagenome]
ENLSETMRIQRKDAELGIEGRNFAVHQLNQQADVLRTAAGSLGAMGNVDTGGGGGLNPVGLMTGMAIGGAMGSQIGGMMTGINQMSSPPPFPTASYYTAVNGQQSGPYSLEQLKQYVQSGEFNKDYYVWKQGMSSWALAKDVPELSSIWGTIPPPVPTTL